MLDAIQSPDNRKAQASYRARRGHPSRTADRLSLQFYLGHWKIEYDADQKKDEQIDHLPHLCHNPSNYANGKSELDRSLFF